LVLFQRADETKIFVPSLTMQEFVQDLSQSYKRDAFKRYQDAYLKSLIRSGWPQLIHQLSVTAWKPFHLVRYLPPLILEQLAIYGMLTDRFGIGRWLWILF
jgi:hypothetical protein